MQKATGIHLRVDFECPKGAMVVLKRKMFRGLYRLVRNVQMGGAIGRTAISDSSGRQVARRKWVTFVSLAKGSVAD